MEITEKEINELTKLALKINAHDALAAIDIALFSVTYFHLRAHIYRNEPYYEYSADNYNHYNPKNHKQIINDLKGILKKFNKEKKELRIANKRKN